MEKAYRHWGHDISDEDTPVEAGLTFTADFDKPGGFIGDEAIANQRATGVGRRLALFKLQDSDTLHWGEGRVSIGADVIALQGRVSPGPDYRVYLSPLFVETEADFMRHKADMVYVGDVKTFENFIVPLPARVRPEAYNTVIVWCEAFGQFISAAQYQP